MSKLRFILAVICLAVMLWSGYNFGREFMDQRRSDSYMEEMSELAVSPRPTGEESQGKEKPAFPETGEDESGDGSEQRAEEPVEPPPIQVDFDLLRRECSDIVGWLYLEDTPISYPVVQGKDNDQYLHHLPDGRYAAAGTLFVDCEQAGDFTDGSTVIYGHNMKSGSMFGTLKRYQDQAYYEDHPTVWLLTPSGDHRVDVFAAFVEPAGSEIYRRVTEKEDLEKLISLAEKKNILDTSVDATGEDRLLILSTCTYDYKDARFVLVGVIK